jgi:SAM-dependent methyltransferase
VGADIFAGQPADPDLLAEIYDLEHDAIVEDLVFYREMARRAPGACLDLGCGSGRLFASLLAGGADPIIGVDGSPALLRRADARIAADPRLGAARDAGRLRTVTGDVRRLDAALPPSRPRVQLAVAAGILPHLDGPEEALQFLAGVGRRLAADGVLILDDLGPGLLPGRDLPLSVDWQGELRGQRVVRRSQLVRRDAPEGLRVLFSTMVDLARPDGTIARLPSSHRLWYPSLRVLAELVREAGLAVELMYGSHELEPLNASSDRRILALRRTDASAAGGEQGRQRRGER